MNRIALSVAVLALIGSSVDGHKHHHSHHGPNQNNKNYVQFLDGSFDIDEKASIAQSKSMYNSIGNLGDRFFEKEVDRSINNFEKINLSEAPVSKPVFHTQHVQSTAQVASDPIYGSLGPKRANRDDLTPEQQFEYDQRSKTAPVYTDDQTVTDTEASIKAAEAIVGAKMAEPCDPKQKAKIAQTPLYTMHGDEDEDLETQETRKSIKTAEKALKTRFFVNAKDKSEFEKGAVNGTVSKQVLDFAEAEDEEIMPVNQTVVVQKEQQEKAVALKKQENLIKIEKAVDPIEKAEVKKEIEEEEKIEKAKEPGPEDLIAKEVKVNMTIPAEVAKEKGLAAFVPPELMGNMGAGAIVDEGAFVPPELMGNMGAGAIVDDGMGFLPPELMGNMGGDAIVVAQRKAKNHQIAQAKKKNDLIREAASLKNKSKGLEDVDF